MSTELSELDKKKKMQHWFGQGQKCFKDGNYEEAIKCFEEVLKLQSDHKPSQQNIDRAKLKLK